MEGFVARRRWQVACGVLACAGACLVPLARPFLDRDRHEGDWAQHVWWTQRFADPGLFPGDPAADFFSRPLLAPPGIRAAYAALVPHLPAEDAARALGALFGVGAAALAFLLGRRLAPQRPGLAGTLAVVGLALEPHGLAATQWGLARSAAMPLLLLGLFGLVARRGLVVAAALVLAALVYPPVGAALWATVLAAFVARAALERRVSREWIGWVVGGVAAGAIVLATYGGGSGAASGVGPKVGGTTARTMAEFGEHGRIRFFTSDPVEYWLRSHASGLGIGVVEALALAACVALVLAARPRWLPRDLVALLAGSLLAFAAAHATLFRLHLPSRATATSIPAFESLAVAAIAARLAATSARGRAGLALAAFAAVGLAAAGVVRATKIAGRPADEEARALHAYLETLPRDAVVAAHPRDADPIPLRARRSVLSSYETALPDYLGYYATASERTRATLEALYATDWDRVDALAGRFRVAAFVVRPERFDRGAARTLWEPYGSFAAPLLRRGGFVLADPPPDRVLFRRGRTTVVRVGAR